MGKYDSIENLYYNSKEVIERKKLNEFINEFYNCGGNKELTIKIIENNIIVKQSNMREHIDGSYSFFKNVLLKTKDKENQMNEHIFALLYNISIQTLSLIKNHVIGLDINTRGNYTTARSIIENVIVLRLFLEDKFDENRVEVFKLNYKLFEYKLLKDNYETNNKDIPEKIKEDYKIVKTQILKILSINNKEFKKYNQKWIFLHGFIENKRPSIHNLFDKFGTKFEKTIYEVCSEEQHVSSMFVPYNNLWSLELVKMTEKLFEDIFEKYDINIDFKNMTFLDDVKKRLEIKSLKKFEKLSLEEFKFVGFVTNKFENQFEKYDFLYQMKKFKEIILDINLDYVMGLGDVVRSKLKLVIEQFAFGMDFFQKVEVMIEEDFNNYCSMHYFSPNIKEKDDDEKLESIFEGFKKRTSSDISYTNFKDKYMKSTLPFTLFVENNELKDIGIVKFISTTFLNIKENKDYYKIIFDENFEFNKMFNNKLIKSRYSESCEFSHPSCYQYLSNHNKQESISDLMKEILTISFYYYEMLINKFLETITREEAIINLQETNNNIQNHIEIIKLLGEIYLDKTDLTK